MAEVGAWLWSSKLTSPPSWLMDRPTIDAGVSIKQSRPWWMNMSFINRASPHEVLSFFTQPIYPSAKDWLTMNVVQSAIMTSSLINLTPHFAEGETWLTLFVVLCFLFFFLAHAHMCTPGGETVSVSSGHFFFFSFWLRDHGKVFFATVMASPLGEGVLDGWERWKIRSARERSCQSKGLRTVFTELLLLSKMAQKNTNIELLPH